MENSTIADIFQAARGTEAKKVRERRLFPKPAKAYVMVLETYPPKIRVTKEGQTVTLTLKELAAIRDIAEEANGGPLESPA